MENIKKIVTSIVVSMCLIMTSSSSAMKISNMIYFPDLNTIIPGGKEMTQTYKVQVSMNQAHIVEPGFVWKQGDFGFQIEIEVLDFDTTGVTPQIIFRKSDGAVESTSVTQSSNKFTYTIQGTELETPGPCICDLKLKNSTTQRISTASFKYFVIPDTEDGLNEQASSYSETIAQIVDGFDDDINNLENDINNYGERFNNESYSAELPVTRENISVGTGSSFVVIPNNTELVKTFETGKTYFVYMEISLSNISGYVAGYIYAQYLYTVGQPPALDYYAGTSFQPVQNGKIILYGFFTSAAGSSRPGLSFRNISAAFSLDITLNKLFLFETNSNVANYLADSPNSAYVFIPKLPDAIVSYNNLDEGLKTILPSIQSNIIDCWGDSLTQGAGSTNYPYPTKLQELLGDTYTVNNYGQGSETAEDIAFRQGALTAIVNPFNIVAPATTQTITGEFVNGAEFGSLNISGLYNGNNRVYIDNNPFMFRRAGNGTFYVGLQGDTSSIHGYSRPQLMRAEGKGTKHISLICIGQNGWKDRDSDSLADIIQLMIDHNGSTQYLVLGRPTGDQASRNEEETILADRFGEHFINLREYISEYGLEDNNLTPTTEDAEAMAIGAIPPSLKYDTVHLNDYGYISMANCVYQRGKTLKYW